MNSEHRATPWVEVALITLSASEKVIGHENTGEQPHTHSPYSYPDKPVLLREKMNSEPYQPIYRWKAGTKSFLTIYGSTGCTAHLFPRFGG
eukprot:COSAG02_NODE_6339_length_3640_cov_2.184411_1_plen_91_part_00